MRCARTLRSLISLLPTMLFTILLGHFFLALPVQAKIDSPKEMHPDPFPIEQPVPLLVKILFMKGDITFKRATNKGFGPFQKLEKDTPLQNTDYIRTGANSLLILSFGPNFNVKLSQNSGMRIFQVLQPDPAPMRTSQIYLQRGKVVVDFIKDLQMQKDDFTVTTPMSKLGIRGTSFFVAVDPSSPLSSSTMPADASTHITTAVFVRHGEVAFVGIKDRKDNPSEESFSLPSGAGIVYNDLGQHTGPGAQIWEQSIQWSTLAENPQDHAGELWKNILAVQTATAKSSSHENPPPPTATIAIDGKEMDDGQMLKSIFSKACLDHAGDACVYLAIQDPTQSELYEKACLDHSLLGCYLKGQWESLKNQKEQKQDHQDNNGHNDNNDQSTDKAANVIAIKLEEDPAVAQLRTNCLEQKATSDCTQWGHKAGPNLTQRQQEQMGYTAHIAKILSQACASNITAACTKLKDWSAEAASNLQKENAKELGQRGLRQLAQDAAAAEDLAQKQSSRTDSSTSTSSSSNEVTNKDSTEQKPQHDCTFETIPVKMLIKSKDTTICTGEAICNGQSVFLACLPNDHGFCPTANECALSDEIELSQ